MPRDEKRPNGETHLSRELCPPAIFLEIAQLLSIAGSEISCDHRHDGHPAFSDPLLKHALKVGSHRPGQAELLQIQQALQHLKCLNPRGITEKHLGRLS